MPVGDRAFGNDIGLHGKVGAEQGEGRGGGKELGVRGGLEVLLVVQGVDGRSVERYYGNAPVRAGYCGIAQDGGDVPGQVAGMGYGFRRRMVRLGEGGGTAEGDEAEMHWHPEC